MKKEERERLHEEDRFIRFMSATWDRITARRRLFLVSVVVAAAVLLILAIVSGISRHSADQTVSAIDRAKTIDEMERVRENHPDEPELLLRLGNAYAVRGEGTDIEKAESTLQRALDLSPSGTRRALILVALGTVKLDLKKCDAALALFDEALKNRDISFLIRDEANWYAGRCLELLGQPDRAADRYSRISPAGRGGTWEALAARRRTKLRQGSVE